MNTIHFPSTREAELVAWLLIHRRFELRGKGELEEWRFHSYRVWVLHDDTCGTVVWREVGNSIEAQDAHF